MIANILSLYFYSVPEAGVEPARPQWTQDFKSGASTDSATQALIYLSGKRDSNSRPRPWQGRALPTELFPQKFCLQNFCGFSSRLGNVQASLTSLSLLRKVRNHYTRLMSLRDFVLAAPWFFFCDAKYFFSKNRERKTRLELATPTLARSCSTN